MHRGLDLSSNNARPLNWTAMFSHLSNLGGGDRPFVVVKVNQGTGYVNPYATEDIADAKAAGFAVAGYLMDEGTADPAGEVALYRKIASVPMFDDDELPNGLTDAEYIAHLRELIAQAPAIQYLNQAEVAAGYPQGTGLWLAQYNLPPTPGVTKYECLIHQYDDVGVIPGCGGEFDLNVWCGSEAQFAQTFGLTPPTPPPVEEYSMLLPVITLANGADIVVQVGNDKTTVYGKARVGDSTWQKATNRVLGTIIPGTVPEQRIAPGGQYQCFMEQASDEHVLVAVTNDGADWGFAELP